MYQNDDLKNESCDELFCRICFEPGLRVNFIAPCACAGSSRWVHRECLNRWRSVREDVAFNKCMECLQEYRLFVSHEDNYRRLCYLRMQFIGLIMVDLALVLIPIQGAIIFIASFANFIDQNKDLPHFFSMEDSTKVNKAFIDNTLS
jgi:hypothetical protein